MSPYMITYFSYDGINVKVVVVDVNNPDEEKEIVVSPRQFWEMANK